MRVATTTSLPAFLLSCLLFTGADAADAPAGKKERLEFPDGSALTVTHADAWQYRPTPANPNLPPSITLTANLGGAVSVQISFMNNVPKPPDTQDKLDQMVKLTSAQYEGGSVEGKTTVEHLVCKNGQGSYARYTDADLVGKEVRPGQFRVVASGVVMYGKTMGIFTVLADSFTQPGFTEALKLVSDGVTRE